MSEKHQDIRDKVLFIRAGQAAVPKGDSPNAFAGDSPYVEGGLFKRILREAWFRLRLPFKEIWYNKRILSFQGEYLLIFDPLITRDYLLWLQKQNKWKLIFYYGNMVGRARHITPDQIPEGIPVWTYDDNNSRTYGLRYNTKSGFDPACCCEKQESVYDVVYVGKDKGRGPFIFRLEKELNAAGLRTFFRVVPETRFDKNKDPRYGESMPYQQICQLVAKSRAILNVGLPGQEGVTVRDVEAVWNNVKLITTNSKTAERNFYDPNNVLIIDENTVTPEQIQAFLDLPYHPYSREFQEEFTTTRWVQEMIEDK